jgi:transcription antitermination protein NusB
MGIRRKGREVALQTLYALSYLENEQDNWQVKYLTNYREKMNDIIADINVKDNSKIINFAEDILSNLIPQLESVDAAIHKNSVNWSIETIAKVDISILRIAVFELLYTQTPAAVIMNEAIEISKKYCSESSGKFINGILNAVSDGRNEK